MGCEGKKIMHLILEISEMNCQTDLFCFHLLAKGCIYVLKSVMRQQTIQYFIIPGILCFYGFQLNF